MQDMGITDVIGKDRHFRVCFGTEMDRSRWFVISESGSFFVFFFFGCVFKPGTIKAAEVLVFSKTVKFSKFFRGHMVHSFFLG